MSGYNDGLDKVRRYTFAASSASVLCSYCEIINGDGDCGSCGLAKTLDYLYMESGRAERIDYIELGHDDEGEEE